jgi:hypothetical protein
VASAWLGQSCRDYPLTEVSQRIRKEPCPGEKRGSCKVKVYTRSVARFALHTTHCDGESVIKITPSDEFASIQCEYDRERRAAPRGETNGSSLDGNLTEKHIGR